MKKTTITLIMAAAVLVSLGGCAMSQSGQGEGENSLAFNASTLAGEPITEAVFADYDLTMINIWATYCDPCVSEMPELQELYAQLPGNVNMITICWDGADDLDLTREIYDYAAGSFMVLFPDEGLIEGLLNSINAVPTTIFVDKDGNRVGDAQIGTPGPPGEDVLVDAYMQLISERLSLLTTE